MSNNVYDELKDDEVKDDELKDDELKDDELKDDEPHIRARAKGVVIDGEEVVKLLNDDLLAARVHFERKQDLICLVACLDYERKELQRKVDSFKRDRDE